MRKNVSPKKIEKKKNFGLLKFKKKLTIEYSLNISEIFLTAYAGLGMYRQETWSYLQRGLMRYDIFCEIHVWL